MTTRHDDTGPRPVGGRPAAINTALAAAAKVDAAAHAS
jgi:hypothetical protein